MTTIDATVISLHSKQLKAHLTLSIVTFLGGFALLAGNLGYGSNPVLQATGIAVTSGGVLWALTTKVRMWWNHG